MLDWILRFSFHRSASRIPSRNEMTRVSDFRIALGVWMEERDAMHAFGCGCAASGHAVATPPSGRVALCHELRARAEDHTLAYR